LKKVESEESYGILCQQPNQI